MSPYKWRKKVDGRRKANHDAGKAANAIGPAAFAHVDRLDAMLGPEPKGSSKGGACNRTACQRHGATWWNPSTRA